MPTQFLIMLTHLVLLTFFCSIASHTVIPDGGYYPNAKCLHCHDLQYYLQNNSKHFTSNTQFLFLPGLHHLYTDLIIQNVHNISIIGRNGSTSSVIQCNSSAGIIIKNITNLLIENMVIKNCLTHHMSSAVVILTECSDVKLQYLQIYQPRHRKGSSLQVHNIMGDLYLNHITCDEGLRISCLKTYTTTNDYVIHLEHYKVTDNFTGYYAILVDFRKFSGSFRFQISSVIIKRGQQSFLSIQAECMIKCSTIIFSNCKFNNFKINKDKVLFQLSNINAYFTSCHFMNNEGQHKNMIISIHRSKTVALMISFKNCIFHRNKVKELIKVTCFSNLRIEHCEFYDNSAQIINYASQSDLHGSYAQLATIIIKNSTFICNKLLKSVNYLVEISQARLVLIGPVKFIETSHIITYEDFSIIFIYNSTITAIGYIEFSQNIIVSLIEYYECTILECFTMNVGDNTTLVITNNTVGSYFMVRYDSEYFVAEKLIYVPCFFQYPNSSTKDGYTNHSIIFKRNTINLFLYISLLIDKFLYFFSTDIQARRLPITHCYWLPHSIFTTTIPLDVNEKYIKFINNSEYLPQMTTKKLLCYCTNDMLYDCYKDDLGYVYPGQTVVVSFHFPDYFRKLGNAEVSVDISKNGTHFTPCVIYRPTELIQFVGKNCTTLRYTIVFPNDNWCELFLKLPLYTSIETDVFYVRQLLCPLGFIKKDGICQCYPLLAQFGITDCDINNQTILRPTNSWISAKSKGNYYISLDCPFQYCIWHSFHLNLSTPDSQCQFNRSGVLCGQCQVDLSTVFGSPNCQHCSSMYLLLIIPITIAGMVLVLLLFLLNLTVTDGAINAFILYANIISINSATIFPYNQNTFAYIFISLANLDLGIQTCFTMVWMTMLRCGYN